MKNIVKSTNFAHMNQENTEKISVLFPVYNEEASISPVLVDLPWNMLDTVVVVDNGSTNNIVRIASDHSTVVLSESKRG